MKKNSLQFNFKFSNLRIKLRSLTSDPFRPDPLAPDRPDDVAPLAEQLRVPWAFERDVPAHRNSHYISDRYFETQSIHRDIEQIYLDFLAVVAEEQDLAALLLPFHHPPVEGTARRFAAFGTAQAPGANARGDGVHPGALAGMALEQRPAVDHSK